MRAFFSCFSLLLMAVPAFAEQAATKILPPVSQRFAPADSGEQPDFQKHVIPLLGRLGCNGRACHGSFQGRGGFQLSLFGYDFQMDHAALHGKADSTTGTRINVKQPEQSLILRKALQQVDHEGGERFTAGSWEHHLFQRWIETGARGTQTPRQLKELQIEPAEVIFHKDSRPLQLQVVAVWQDGSREDVTPLCRFRSNDDTVVSVSENGELKTEGPGDTHLIAFYDNGVAALPVMRALSEQGQKHTPPTPARTKIDTFIEAKLNKLGIQPSPVCTDAEFLRRVSIDLTGTLPAPQEIEIFLADPSPSKRDDKIDELLQRPAYAAWWANRLCDFTGCNPNQQAELGQDLSVQWYTWIFQRLQENLPYDQLIERIVLSRSREEDQSFLEYSQSVSAYFRDQAPAEFENRRTMPHYWTRRTMQKPEDKALAFAHSFLGIRLQCAQCHKHPFAPWTQTNFQQFSAFFKQVEFGVQPDADKEYRQLAQKVGLNVRGKQGAPIRPDVLKHAQAGRVIPWRELYIAPQSRPARLSLLRSGTVEISPGDDPRSAIMNWMKNPDNPWFARAFVNRVWAGYFHAGIIDPPDELNAANPPSHPQLLDWLSSEFIAHDYDMQWLHRQIVSSDAYQRSRTPNATNSADRRNFSRAIPRRLPAEIVYDGIKQAVAASDEMDSVRTDLTRRAIGHLSMRLAGTYAMHVFGKPERAVNCDCERVNQPTLLQSIFMQNDPLVEQRLAGSGWIEEIAALEQAGGSPDRAALIRTAWLRTVGREPNQQEIERAEQHLAQCTTTAEGISDLLWALLNTKEFMLNH